MDINAITNPEMISLWNVFIHRKRDISTEPYIHNLVDFLRFDNLVAYSKIQK